MTTATIIKRWQEGTRHQWTASISSVWHWEWPVTGPFEFFTIDVSVRLSDRSLNRVEQKRFRQKLPPVGLETRTSRSSGQCLTNWARQESVGQEISEVSFVCFMHHFICWTLFISRINRAWLYKGHEDSNWQLNVDLAQMVRHWPEDPEVLVSNAHWG